MSIYIELSAQQIATCDFTPFLAQRQEILDEGICEIFADPNRYVQVSEQDHELVRYCAELLRIWPGLSAHCEPTALSFLAQSLGDVVGYRVVSCLVVNDLRQVGKSIPTWLFESIASAKEA